MEEYIKFTKVIECINDCIKKAKDNNSDRGIDYDEGYFDALRDLKHKLIDKNNKNQLGN